MAHGKWKLTRRLLSLATGMVGAAATVASAQDRSGSSAPLSIESQGHFFSGGEYVQTKDGQVMVGQMFVQYRSRPARRHPYPIVMIHGGGQTGTNFLGTPDGSRKTVCPFALARATTLDAVASGYPE